MKNMMLRLLEIERTMLNLSRMILNFERDMNMDFEEHEGVVLSTEDENEDDTETTLYDWSVDEGGDVDGV